MYVSKIKKLDNVIQLPPNTTIEEYKIERLTAPGENYGSLMLQVDLTVRTDDGIQKVKTVAKVVPPNDFIQQVFRTQVSFRNEIAFYKIVIPTLQQFQKEKGIQNIIDFAAKYYGGRINLVDDQSSRVDENGIIFLENLKYSGYTTLNKTEGVDLDVSKLILKELALFHAVPLALKLKNSDLFNQKIQKYLYTASPGDHWIGEFERMRDKLEKITDNSDLINRVLKGLNMKQVLEPREPFATVVHNDLWTNNAMIKFEGSLPTRIKLIDFQECSYGSPARDVVFFLFSTVRSSVITENYDFLVAWYHSNFINTLKQLQCDIESFSFDAFKKELDFEARNSQFFHVMMMLVPIFAPKGTVKEIHELTVEDMRQPAGMVTNAYLEKLKFVVSEWDKRSWI